MERKMKSRLIATLVSLVALNASAEDGYLKLRANVDGVRISVGSVSQTIGTEWSFITLPSGNYQVEASKQYYQTQSRNVSIQSGRVVTMNFDFQEASGFKVEKPKDVSVVKGYGALTIVTDIPGATVRLNGQSVTGEVAPMTVKELAEGEWLVEVSLRGNTLQKMVNIEPNQLSTAHFFFDIINERKYKDEEQRKLNAQNSAKEDQLRKTIRSQVLRDNPRIFLIEDFAGKSHYNNEKKSSSEYWKTRGGWKSVDECYSRTGGYKSDIVDVTVEQKRTAVYTTTVVEPLRTFSPAQYSQVGTITVEYYINGRFVASSTRNVDDESRDNVVDCGDFSIKSFASSYKLEITIKNYDLLIDELVESQFKSRLAM